MMGLWILLSIIMFVVGFACGEWFQMYQQNRHLYKIADKVSDLTDSISEALESKESD